MVFILAQAKHTVILSTSSLGVRLWSVKFWKPARGIAGLAGETLHGTLFVRSIVEFTYKFKGCTSSGLVGSIGPSSLSP